MRGRETLVCSGRRASRDGVRRVISRSTIDERRDSGQTRGATPHSARLAETPMIFAFGIARGRAGERGALKADAVRRRPPRW